MIEIVTGDLAQSRTFARRSWVWLPTPGAEQGDGNLTICQARSRMPGASVEVDTYQVQEQPRFKDSGRTFLLLNQTDSDQPDVYETHLGVKAHCTCKAGRVGKFECKHVAALRSVIAEGGLPEPREFTPQQLTAIHAVQEGEQGQDSEWHPGSNRDDSIDRRHASRNAGGVIGASTA